jgi:hypothetical protein
VSTSSAAGRATRRCGSWGGCGCPARESSRLSSSRSPPSSCRPCRTPSASASRSNLERAMPSAAMRVSRKEKMMSSRTTSPMHSLLGLLDVVREEELYRPRRAPALRKQSHHVEQAITDVFVTSSLSCNLKLLAVGVRKISRRSKKRGDSTCAANT